MNEENENRLRELYERDRARVPNRNDIKRTERLLIYLIKLYASHDRPDEFDQNAREALEFIELIENNKRVSYVGYVKIGADKGEK